MDTEAQKMWKKNDLITLVITDAGESGEGIGRVDGLTFFVKGAVVGDRVLAKIMKMKKSYGYARLMELLTPSEDRIESPCKAAGRCGGCQLSSMNYPAQLTLKEQKVKNCLSRIGGVSFETKDILFHPICGMERPEGYRNKAQFPVGTDSSQNPVTGFYAEHSHQVIPCDACAIQAKGNELICSVIKSHMKKYHISAYNEETGTGLVRHIMTRIGFYTGEVMVCLVINGEGIKKAEELAEELRKQISSAGLEKQLRLTSFCLDVNKDNTNVILSSRLIPVFGELFITDQIGELSFRISPLSFFQVNPVQTRVLYETALSFAGLTGEETVFDLYCGIGTISLFLAQKAKHVIGVEIVPEAIEDAKGNAERNRIYNADFFVGAAEEVIPRMFEESNDSLRADVIVVDPPRKGCEESLLKTIISMTPERIVYVSCDPATLARDVKYLISNGYELMEVQPVDMFPWTVHVETVALLTKPRDLRR